MRLAELDTDYLNRLCIERVKNAGRAAEGAGADTYTYRIACRLREKELSHDVAFELILEHAYGERIAFKLQRVGGKWLASSVSAQQLKPPLAHL